MLSKDKNFFEKTKQINNVEITEKDQIYNSSQNINELSDAIQKSLRNDLNKNMSRNHNNNLIS